MDILQIVGVIVGSAAGAGTILKLFAEKSIEAGIQKALHKEQLLTTTELEFRKRQIEEFYGPIYASLKLNSTIYPLWINQKFSDVNMEIIGLFKKQNDEIVTILKTKAHLIDGAKYPTEFTRFMTSAAIWGMYSSRPEKPWVPQEVANIPDVKWPHGFVEHIYSKTEELKQRLDTLLKKYRAS
jgi:hypothetical protein